MAIKRSFCLAMRAPLKKGKVVLFSPLGICLDIDLKVMKSNHVLVPPLWKSPISHSEIIHKKFSTFFRKWGEGYSEGMCKKESFLCGNKVIIYTERQLRGEPDSFESCAWKQNSPWELD